MNRRGFLKLLGAAIAAPFVGKVKIAPNALSPGSAGVKSKWVKFEIQDSPGTFRDITSSVSSCTFTPDTDLSTMGIDLEEMMKGIRVEIGRTPEYLPLSPTCVYMTGEMADDCFITNYHFFIDDGNPAEWQRVQYTSLADAIEDAEPGDYIIAIPDEYITLAQPQPIEWQPMQGEDGLLYADKLWRAISDGTMRANGLKT